MNRDSGRPPVGTRVAGLGALAALALGGCATPSQRIDDQAASFGYTRVVMQGDPYRHVVYSNGHRHDGELLHVYLEGDGTPYLDRWTVAPDPTPRDPLMLRLMARDSAPSVYVGRPCYFGLATDPPCTPYDWTLGRFSEQVVASLAAVVERVRVDTGASGLALFGHSGGGALAVLLAERMQPVRRIVTLAGNLDTDAWADLHSYTRLSGSLNPSRRGPLPVTIEQRHYAGGRDRVVPPQLIKEAAARLGATAIEVLPVASHADGWEAAWPAILADHADDPGAAISGTSSAGPR